MKKYLIKGVLALFVGALLFSCSEKESEYVPLAQQKVQAFEEVFKEVYGDNIDPYQRWGFSDKSNIANGDDVEPTIIDEEPALIRTFRAGTRGNINVNGNEWDDYPTLETNEAKDVANYVRGLKEFPNDLPDNLRDYYVTHVYTGEETYTNADGGSGVLGSAHMDNLHIALESGGVVNDDGSLSSVGKWTHINNFNAASNVNWGGNTLVVDGGTYNFAYHGSEDSRYHDRWIAIDGAKIPKTGGGNYAGKYYVCFDFEGVLSNGYTPITNAKWENPNSQNSDKWENIGETFYIPGNWTAAQLAASDLTIEHTYYQWNSETQANEPHTVTLHLNSSYDEVRDIQVGNYVGGNMEIAGNNIYDDWIIRLIPASPKPKECSRVYTWNRIEDEWAQDTEQSGRVFCEDLGKATRYDIDYNDVVFDVIIWQHTHTVQPMKKVVTWTTTNGVKDANSEESTGAYADGSPSEHTVKKYAQVRLMAAGGTIYLTVLNQEVHDAFGVGVTTMVNTRDDKSTAFGSYQDLNPVDIGTFETSVPFNGTTYNLKLFENISTADQVTIISNFNGNTIAELTAKTGEAPHKLFVPNFTTQWTSERMQLKDAYPAFAGYVYNSTNMDWYKNYEPDYLYSKRYVGLETMPRVMKTVRISDTENMDNLTSTTYPFGSNWNLYEIYLQNVSSFTPGDRIRFYASGVSEGSRIRVLFANSSSNYLVDADYVVNDKDNGANTSNACIEVILDDASCQELNNSKKEGKLMIQVQGKDFVLDRITRLAAAQ